MSTTCGVGKQEKEGLSDITLEKGASRAHSESRKFCLVAATVSEPGESHRAGTHLYAFDVVVVIDLQVESSLGL